MLPELLTKTQNLYETIHSTGLTLLKDAIKIKETSETPSALPPTDQTRVTDFYNFEPILEEKNSLTDTIAIAIGAIQESMGLSNFLGEISEANVCGYNLDKSLIYKMTENYLEKTLLLQQIDYFITSETLLT
jgi:hypothetical protein